MEGTDRPSRVPVFAAMRRLPGGLMLVPLALGVLAGTFAPAALEIGSFTTALFSDGAALTLIGLLVLATGAQITGSRSGGGAADPRFAPFAPTAAAQAATAVLVTALLAPATASFVLRRARAGPPRSPLPSDHEPIPEKPS